MTALAALTLAAALALPGVALGAALHAWRIARHARRRRARGAWRQVVALGPLAALPAGEDGGA